MTQASNEPFAADAADAPPVAMAPLSYASADTDERVSGWMRGWLITFASVLLIIGSPGVLFPLVTASQQVLAGASILSMEKLLIIIGAPMVLSGACVIARSPRTWKYACVSLFGMAGLQLVATGIFAGIAIWNRNATGWDRINIGIGIAFGIAASVLFWVNLIPTMYIIGVKGRRAFGLKPLRTNADKYVTWGFAIFWAIIAATTASVFYFH